MFNIFSGHDITFNIAKHSFDKKHFDRFDFKNLTTEETERIEYYFATLA